MDGRNRFITAAIACFLFGATSGAQSQRPAAPPKSVDLRILSTTDLHGRVRGWDYYGDSAESARGLARLATIVDSVRADQPTSTILVDAGDFLQGNALTYIASKSAFAGVNPVVAAMNEMKYDAAVLGNHEFNYGIVALDKALLPATFPVLAANARRIDAKKQWLPMTYLNRAGVKVAVIGVTNRWSMMWDRDNLKGHAQIDDIVASVRRSVTDARRVGVDVVVVVAHAGLDSPRDEPVEGVGFENPMSTVAREVPGIDLIVFGHTHREVADTSINGVLLVQPRNWGQSLSVAELHLELDARKWKVKSKRGVIVQARGHAEQAEIVKLVEAPHAAARRYATTTIGRTTTAWTTDSARTTDVAASDFVGEIMRRATGADLASNSVFSTTVRIPAGPLSVAQIAQLYPYDNTIDVVRISGATLKEFIEQSARYYRVTSDGGTLHAAPDAAVIGYNFEVVTGADYTVDLTRPVGDRVVGLSVKGKPVTAADTFRIALSNYRSSGTGGYTMLIGARREKTDGREIRQMLIDEITKKKDFNAADYFTPNWKLVPPALAAEVQAVLDHQVPFEAVRKPPPGGGPPDVGVEAAQARKATTIRVISTNDFHGGLEARPDGNAGMRGGAGQFAAVVRRIMAECTGSCAPVLVDGGDEFQGTPASNLAYGRPVVALYNALGYAAAAIGNHDFDWGQDTLRARMRDAKYAMLGANITYADGKPVPWIRGDTIVERGGVKIGIIGLATVTTPAVTKIVNVSDLRFLKPGPVVVTHSKSLRARGAEFVIATDHASGNCTETTCTGETSDIAHEAAGFVDAVVGGHSHLEFSAIIDGIPTMRARSSGRAVSYVDIPVDKGARHDLAVHLVYVATDSVKPESDIDRLVAAATAPVKALVDRPVATIAETMRRSGGGPQYALGNFIADAQRFACGTELSVMNNGGIRVDLMAGPATYGTFFELEPFGNLLVRMTASGADLKTYFEHVVGGRGPALHVSGALMKYDPSRPSGDRIVEISVGGKPLDPARRYTMCMSDFMSTGGDGLAIAGPAHDEQSTGIVDLDALLDYVKTLPGGVLRPDKTIRIAPVP